MKEFKIKAWLKKEKKMVSIIGIDFNYEYIRYTEDGNLFNENYKTAEFKDIELLEFSGEKDNNKSEIYKGDILLSSNENGIFLISIDFGYPNIEYSNMLTGFQIKTEIILSDGQYFECFNNNLIELINKYNIPIAKDNNTKYISDGWWILGNIYENPELLGGKNE